MKLKEAVICHYCKRPTKNPTKDHIYPLSKIRSHRKKGEPIPDNVDLDNNKVVSCGICNINKADMDYHKFISLGLMEIRRLRNEYWIKNIKPKQKKR